MARPYTFNPSCTVHIEDWVAPPFTGVRAAIAMQMTPWLSFDEELTTSGNCGYVWRFLLDPNLTPLVPYFQDPTNFHRIRIQPSNSPNLGIVEAIPIMDGNTRHCWLAHAVRFDLLTQTPIPETMVLSAPIGMIMPYAASTVLDGWENCWGQAISRATFGELFLLIGTTYGAGDGVSTYNLPDLRSRMVLGTHPSSVSPFNLGELGGAINTTLIIANLPPHGHQVPYSLNVGSVGTVRLGDAGTGGAFTTGLSNGASTPFSRFPPYQVISYIIKARHVSGEY